MADEQKKDGGEKKEEKQASPYRALLTAALFIGLVAAGPIISHQLLQSWDSENEKDKHAAGEKLKDPVTPYVHPSNRPSLEEAIDFGITPQWILSYFPHVTNVSIDPKLIGYRVPLVTGTKMQDIAGSMTYEFCNRQMLQRMTFVGSTGDAKAIIALVEKRFALVGRETNQPNLFVFESTDSNGKVRNVLHVEIAPRLDRNSPQTQFQVKLRLFRPDGQQLSKAKPPTMPKAAQKQQKYIRRY